MPARPWASWPVRITPLWTVALETLVVLATVAVILGSAPWATTYAGASGLAALADLAAGAGLLIAGIMLGQAGRPERLVVLSTVAGLSWLAADWIGWQGGPPFIRTLAMVAAAWVPAIVLDLAISFGGDRTSRGSLRRMVGGAYLLTGGAAVLAVLFRDPRFALDCWANCTDDVLLLASLPAVGSAISVAEALIAAIIGLALVWASGLRLLRSVPTARRLQLPVLAPAIAVGGTITAHNILLLALSRQGPEIPAFAALYVARALSLASMAAGLVVSVADARRRRGALARLADEFEEGARAEPMVARLRRALGDASIEIAWWLPTVGRFVDESGRPIPPPERRPGRELATVARDGIKVAVISRDTASGGGGELEREFGPAARLGFDNERLRVEALAQLEELRESRARIVARGDAERVRLERNLHDGAQQRLLAVLHQISMARASIDDRSRSTSVLDERLGAAAAATRDLMSELRRVAEGIHPAVLSERGLRPALLALADVTPVPLEVISSPAVRRTPEVEQAAYAFVSGAVDLAVAAGFSSMAVRVVDAVETLSVSVAVDDVARIPRESLDDRVGAAGGRLVVDGPILVAEFPCAS